MGTRLLLRVGIPHGQELAWVTFLASVYRPRKCGNQRPVVGAIHFGMGLGPMVVILVLGIDERRDHRPGDSRTALPARVSLGTRRRREFAETAGGPLLDPLAPSKDGPTPAGGPLALGQWYSILSDLLAKSCQGY